MGTRENEFQSLENLCKHKQNFIISFISPVSFHQYFQVFHTKFNVRFRRLVLLGTILFAKIFETVVQKFAIRCK